MQTNPGTEGPIIEIKGLSKVYNSPEGGTFNALTDVNLTIERGDIFGIIGMSPSALYEYARKAYLGHCYYRWSRP